MDVLKEIRDLEKQGVFIHFVHEHYVDGTNCNFSIAFANYDNQTGWYGDNHEFGDVADCMEAAIKFAKWLLIEDNGKEYFANITETVTEEGRAKFRRHSEFMRECHSKLYHEFNNNREKYERDQSNVSLD